MAHTDTHPTAPANPLTFRAFVNPDTGLTEAEARYNGSLIAVTSTHGGHGEALWIVHHKAAHWLAAHNDHALNAAIAIHRTHRAPVRGINRVRAA